MNIKLSTLTEAMDFVLDEAIQEYDKASGEIHLIYDGMVDGEINQELEEYICESDDFITLPEKYEINDYEIMREFIYTLPNGKLQDNLLNAISGRGAFRRFREVLDDYGKTEKWYAYKEAAYEQIARDWAERNDIEIIEDIPSKLDALEMEASEETMYELAARYWTDKERYSSKMPETELMSYIEEFVKAHNTCALATGSDGFVRCTPIEYNYVNGAFYMFSEGGLKFKALCDNKNVSMAIYDEYCGFDNLGGLQIQGTAELIPAGTDEYFQVMDHKKLPHDAFDKMEQPMHLIKVTPQSMDYLNSELKKLGYDTRQHIELKYLD